MTRQLGIKERNIPCVAICNQNHEKLQLHQHIHPENIRPGDVVTWTITGMNLTGRHIPQHIVVVNNLFGTHSFATRGLAPGESKTLRVRKRAPQTIQPGTVSLSHLAYTANDSGTVPGSRLSNTETKEIMVGGTPNCLECGSSLNLGNPLLTVGPNVKISYDIILNTTLKSLWVDISKFFENITVTSFTDKSYNITTKLVSQNGIYYLVSGGVNILPNSSVAVELVTLPVIPTIVSHQTNFIGYYNNTGDCCSDVVQFSS